MSPGLMEWLDLGAKSDFISGPSLVDFEAFNLILDGNGNDVD